MLTTRQLASLKKWGQVENNVNDIGWMKQGGRQMLSVLLLTTLQQCSIYNVSLSFFDTSQWGCQKKSRLRRQFLHTLSTKIQFLHIFENIFGK